MHHINVVEMDSQQVSRQLAKHDLIMM